MSRVALLVASSVLWLGGCAVSGAGISESEVAINQCSRDSDCTDNASCVQNLCQGRGTSLTALLVAVTPPPTLAGINSFTYFTDFTKELVPGKGGGQLDIPLDSAVTMTGSIYIDTTACKSVATDPTLEPSWQRGKDDAVPTDADGRIPAIATFVPSQGGFGVPVDSFSAGPLAGGYVFNLTVPSGEYDAYVKPAYPLSNAWAAIPECQVPPLLLHNAVATSKFNAVLPPPSKLKINVTWPLVTGPTGYEPGSEQTDRFLLDPLYGWTLDIVDQSSGRVLSTSEAPSSYLVTPVQGATSVTYAEVPLVYSHVSVAVNGVLEPVNVGTEIIRLTPPAFDPRFPGASLPFTAPTFLVQLDGALVDADGKPAPAQIVQNAPLATAVTVQFQTALHEVGTPVPAGVLITAEELDGITGLSTSFSRSVQVGTDGVASIDLLPGRYRVVAEPQSGCNADGCLALAQTEWVVGATPPWQGGKTIEFTPADIVSGTAFVNGRPAAGAIVNAVPSLLTLDRNVLNIADANSAIVPRASSGLVESDASFSFEADNGVFDLRVQPDPSTGYGWLVRPALDLTASGGTSLDQLNLDLPVIYSGTVTGSVNGLMTPLPKALIRAYAYIKSDGTVPSKLSDATYAIQVAETYSEDASGNPGAFRLLLPKQLQP